MLDSARKHGVTDEDILHAYRNPISVFEPNDLTMIIGAATNGALLEIGISTAEGIDFIVHAMSARPKYLGD